MKQKIDLYAFYSSPALSQEVIEAGISGLVVDWEFGEKERRQNLYNTQINRHGEQELREARQLTDRPIICRINGGDHWTEDQTRLAMDLGADCILLPMVKSLGEVEQLLRVADGKVQVGIMIETLEAVELASQIGRMPIDKAYVGLNDLSIARKSHNIFTPLIDGTLDEIRPHFSCDFGVAGLTHPELGNPIPSRLLLQYMDYLQVSFTFLRRSFYRDMHQYTAQEMIQAIHNSRNPQNLENDLFELKRHILEATMLI
ncbi:MAG TPA: aldolase [Cytophagales bacterium]|nr:aldolase [Cytophagales bacterium]HAA24084.1 aldolase [Cytophagales bacterium]HAP63387.1 aldolase [Cytophagales bacterium]